MRSLLAVFLIMFGSLSFGAPTADYVPGEIYAENVTRISDKLLVSKPFVYSAAGELIPLFGSRMKDEYGKVYKNLFEQQEGTGACRSLGFSTGRVSKSTVKIDQERPNYAAKFNTDGSYAGASSAMVQAIVLELECME